MISLHAELHALPDHVAEVGHLLEDLLAVAAAEPGNVGYAIHRAAAAPTTFLLYELYVDRAACDAHLASPPVVAALGRFAQLLREPPRVALAELVRAHGSLREAS